MISFTGRNVEEFRQYNIERRAFRIAFQRGAWERGKGK